MAPGPEQALSAVASGRGRGFKVVTLLSVVIAWSLLAASLGAHSMSSQMQAQLEEAQRGIAELREAVRRQKGDVAALAGSAAPVGSVAAPAASVAAPAASVAAPAGSVASPKVASGAEASVVASAATAGGASAAAGGARVGLKVIAADEVRRLAFVNLADEYSVTLNSGCVAIEMYGTTLSLDSTSCNMIRCPPCFVLNGSDMSFASSSPLTLTISKCSSMMLSNSATLGQGRFQEAAQRIDFLNFVDQPAIISDGITKYMMPPRSSAFGTCSARGKDRLLMSGTGYEVQRFSASRLSAAGAVWSLSYTYPTWSARAYFAAYEAPDGRIWVDKGKGSSDAQLSDRNYYDSGSQYWYQHYEQTAERRFNHKIVALADGMLLLFGGASQDRTPSACTDLMSSRDGETWTTETSNTGIAGRQRYQVAVHGVNVYVVADRQGPNTLLKDVYEGSPPWSNTWSQKTSDAEFGGREMHTVVARTDGALVLMGGRNSSDMLMNDVWVSTDQGASWQILSEAAEWGPRADFGAFVRGDGHILIVSGLGFGGGGYQDVWQSVDGGHYWSLLCPLTAFTPRRGFTLVYKRDGSVWLIGGQSHSDAGGQNTWTETNDIYVSGELGWGG